VRSPLQEAGLTKAEIREMARALGLPNWDKPAAACLSSRIPYGTAITLPCCRRSGRPNGRWAKWASASCGCAITARWARIEVEPADFLAVLTLRGQIVEQFKALGYAYVTLDLAGFRSGSMNEVIAPNGHTKTTTTAG